MYSILLLSSHSQLWHSNRWPRYDCSVDVILDLIQRNDVITLVI